MSSQTLLSQRPIQPRASIFFDQAWLGWGCLDDFAALLRQGIADYFEDEEISLDPDTDTCIAPAQRSTREDDESDDDDGSHTAPKDSKRQKQNRTGIG